MTLSHAGTPSRCYLGSPWDICNKRPYNLCIFGACVPRVSQCLTDPLPIVCVCAGGDGVVEAREAGRAAQQQFISAVAWRPNSHALLVANSQGSIKVMQLTGADA